MSRSRYIFIPTVLLMLAAGVVVGRLSTNYPKPAAGPSTQQSRWFDEQLNLSAQQRTQMDAIWAETKQKMQKAEERQRATFSERDAAIRALFTEEQKAKYDAINDNFRKQRSELDKEREKAMQEANDRSRALLDESQKKHWDELTKERRERHGRDGRGGRGGPRGPSTQRSQDGRPGGMQQGSATTQPTAQRN